MGEFIIWWLAGSLFVFFGTIVYNRYIVDKDSDALTLDEIVVLLIFGPISIIFIGVIALLIGCMIIFMKIGDKINGTPVYNWLLGKDRRHGKTK